MYVYIVIVSMISLKKACILVISMLHTTLEQPKYSCCPSPAWHLFGAWLAAAGWRSAQ